MDMITPDILGLNIANKFQTWETLRNVKVAQWKEITEYIFATDTTVTPNSKLPWSNKTTIPKLCQIRDNLHANYMATLFPKSKWLEWQGDDEESNTKDKRETIEQYMNYVIDRNQFYDTCSRLVYDFIDYGNVFVMPEWYDGTNVIEDRTQVGYVGPILKRISPLDIVFNPVSPTFEEAPKIIRSLVSMGEVKAMLEAESADEDEKEIANSIFQYMKDLRHNMTNMSYTVTCKDRIFQIAGFTTYQAYLESNEVEVLTFYGDIWDEETNKLYKNQVIKVVDRHKVIYNKPNKTFFGTAPIYHCGWRLRPDNLWAMGPLDNLVGMQYRIDHLENMKADCFDLIAYPPLKIKGYVEDFKWAPMEKIIVGDDSDVEMMSPDVQVLQCDNQIAILENKMEEMAGSPKEAMGFRTPGEKTAYEVQRMENAASRIFQNKIGYFERQIIENVINAMLEMARRNVTKQTIKIFDNDMKFDSFMDLTAYDITGNGRIKPMAARHFAEKAQIVQNLNNFLGSPAGQDQMVNVHFSGEKLAKAWECLLEIEPYKIVQPYIRLMEQAEAQKLAQAAQQNVAMQAATPTGFLPGDHDQEIDSFNLPEPTDSNSVPAQSGGGTGAGVVPGNYGQ